MLVVLALVVCWGVPGGGIRGPHHPRHHHHHDHHHHQPQAQTKLTQDSELIRDVEHIKEDLGDWGMSKEALQSLTPEELDFHYFKLHDFDNNTKLDGLEILQAIHHTVHKDVEEEEGGSGDHAPNAKPPPQDELPYFIELIDQVLAEDDQDNDGFLSYMEYVIGRQREQTKQDSDKPNLHSHG